MTDYLAPARAKIKRAEKHLNDLEGAISVFRRNAYTITRERSLDRHNHVLRVDIVKAMPIEFALMIADCAHNLHTALHYLVVGDILKKGSHAQIPRGTGFPINETREAFRGNTVGKMKRSSDKARR
jgi:hypothetical protein